MKLKKILIIVFLAVFGLLFNYAGPAVAAMTAEEMNELISKLQAQIAQLQQQMGQTSSTSQTVWCHNFNTSITVGSIGLEVEALHLVLEKEGLTISQDEKLNREYDESTASAVTGLQEKYRNDILNPLGLRYGTGFVGKGTRAKLNQLYGCKGVTSTPVKPETLQPETTQPVTPTQETVISTTVTPAGSDTHRFEILDSGGCPPCLVGTICKPCPPKSEYTIYNAKISVYNAKGVLIDTKDTSSGMAVFENLPYSSYTTIPWGNYTAVISAEGYVTDKLQFTVCTTCATDSMVFLKKSSTTTSSSIVVLSPNGGETYKIGGIFTVKWTPGSPGISQIYLERSDGYSNGIMALIPPNTSGSWSLTIPDNFPAGEYYVKLYYSDGKKDFADSSDRPFTIISSTSPTQPSITILSPNGGENWASGSTQKISWTSSGIPADHKIMVIRLRDSNGVEYYLLTDTLNDGFAQITVPTTLTPGYYQLEIKTSVNGQTVFDQSDTKFNIGTTKTSTIYEQVKCVFKNSSTKQQCYSATTSTGANYSCVGIEGCVVDVKSPQGEQITWKSSCGGYAYTTIDGTNEYADFTCPLVVTPPNSIIVLSPNGGENWEIGKTYDISWNTVGLNNVIIWLNKYNADMTNGCRLTSGSVSGGKYSWTIGKDLCSITSGDKFKILVQEADETHQPRIEDLSDNFFSIVTADSTTPTQTTSQTTSTTPTSATPVSIPAIYVLTPKGGEQFRVGDDIVIQWKNSGMAGVVGLQQNVQLVRSSDKTIILNLGSTAGASDLANIKWHVNADPGNYYIRVYNSAPSGIGGEGTSSSFSVIVGSTGLKDIENQLANISSAILKLLEEIKK